ncbi:hypothetical protein FH972_026639 [Carpinus fangiana]|uniref:Uncharacterized protein n=1 Tax=Carpinus fangiana TaxID=176857 RepID=A0A5N6L506_9ROSI|nr:hypothetical protein FH972_026639 [Carpinus fangiana]
MPATAPTTPVDLPASTVPALSPRSFALPHKRLALRNLLQTRHDNSSTGKGFRCMRRLREDVRCCSIGIQDTKVNLCYGSKMRLFRATCQCDIRSRWTEAASGNYTGENSAKIADEEQSARNAGRMGDLQNRGANCNRVWSRGVHTL